MPLHAEILNNDLTLVYIGARIGIEHGWSHIYSLPLQHSLFTTLRPSAVFSSEERFLSPPPSAWLLVPLSAFGAATAVYLWIALSSGALVAAWWLAAPGVGLRRWVWLLAALAWYPVLYSLRWAQPDLIILCGVAVSWWLASRDRPFLAGVALGALVLKPQVAIALPLVLLAAGRWRIVAGFAVTAGALALISLAIVGSQGLSDYQALLRDAQGVVGNRYFTLAYLVGPGVASYALQGAVTVAGVAAAYINRSSGLDRLYVLGLLTTALGATYWHLQDYTMLVLAVWLFWCSGPPRWLRWWLLVVALAGELAWPLRPLPILFAIAVWWAWLLVPGRTGLTRTASQTSLT